MVAEISAISCPILICSDKHALDHTMSRAHFFDRNTSHFRRPFGRLFYFLRNLILSQQENKPLGKYGRMRKKYLQEHRPVLWNHLILSEQLYPHLRKIDETANRRLEQMMPELMQSAGVTEALKTSDPMKWVGLMNNLKAQAEEVILTELIYT